jgi:hypothetical protein
MTMKIAIIATRIGFANRFMISNFATIIRNLLGCVHSSRDLQSDDRFLGPVGIETTSEGL